MLEWLEKCGYKRCNDNTRLPALKPRKDKATLEDDETPEVSTGV